MQNISAHFVMIVMCRISNDIHSILLSRLLYKYLKINIYRAILLSVIRWNLGLLAASCVRIELAFRGPSQSSSLGIWCLMIISEMILETSVQYRHLTRLIARENLIEFSRHGSGRTHTHIYIYIYWPVLYKSWDVYTYFTYFFAVECLSNI